MNIVIPMAGEGKRFVQAGYRFPKPFIDVNGQPMIARVMENLRTADARYLLIAREKDLVDHGDIVAGLKRGFDVTVIALNRLTEGTAATVLRAREEINSEVPVLVANCDQLVDGGIAPMIEDWRRRKLDGSIMVFKDAERNPKWSFARVNSQGLVTETREKKPISDLATVGIYLFARGADLVIGAEEMIANNDRVNNEFYTCPVYNYLIRRRLQIGVHEINASAMHGLGTPEDLTRYLSSLGAPGT